MSRRAWLGVGAALVVIVGVMFAYDALVETDEERLEVFVEDVTGSVTRGRVDVARSRWVDLSRHPFEVSAMGQTFLYQEGQEDELAEQASSSLRTIFGTNLRVMSTAMQIEGDEATVTLRLISRQRGMGLVEWRLVRDGEEWLVERLAVRR